LVKRNMSLIVSNNFLTFLADSIFDLTVLWYVYQLTNSAFFAATTTAITTITSILVGPMIGVFIDRKEPKRSMQLGYAIMILVGIMLGLAYLFKIDGLLSVIYGALILHHICMILINPAQNKLLPRIVGENKIVKAQGYISSTKQTSDLIGQSIGGFIISLIGFVGVMVTHSAVYLLASIILIFVVNISFKKHEDYQQQSKPTLLDDLKEGFKILQSNKPVLKFILLASAINISTVAGSLMVVLVSDQYNASATHFGLMNAKAAGLGIVIGLFAGKLVHFTKPNVIFATMFVLAGVGFGGMGITTSFYIGLVFFLLMTGASTLINIIFGSLMIILIKDEFRGRVGTLTAVVASIFIAPITLAGGYIADIFQVSYLFLFAGVWTALLGVVPLIDSDLRSINHFPKEG